MLKEMFKKTKYATVDQNMNTNVYPQDEPSKENSVDKEPSVPDGAWIKCTGCKKTIYFKEVESNFGCCPNCNKHYRISAHTRIDLLVDEGSFSEWNEQLALENILEFPGYEEKLRGLRASLDISEAVVTGVAKIKGYQVVLAVMDNEFLMGSMGQEVGEKITRAVEYATAHRLSLIITTTSGGARMQEGIVSLMQMAKVSSALKRHSKENLLYITVLTDPTTGGVTASFAMLGDIILAEPGALIGFAGPRVIEQTIKQKLPENFQTAEFLLEKGFVDKIVPRKYMRHVIGRILRMHCKKAVPAWVQKGEDLVNQTVVNERIEEVEETSAWDRVLKAREASRPTSLDYINKIFTKFVEFHGDRFFGDDAAIVGGIALLDHLPVTVIGQQKGRSTKDNIKRNFGMPNPEGYRKALRLMKQAEKFGRPIICLVDTPGAFCGIGAEERGQGEAIARNLMEMSDLTVPIITIVIGEGGSGGALALAVSNQVWMLENSIYSILSPEGFASILWKDSKRAIEAAQVMKITAQDLKDLGVIEEVIQEPENLADNFEVVTDDLSIRLKHYLHQAKQISKEQLIQERYNKYRKCYFK